MRHSLSERDFENKTAVCSQCGPVKMYINSKSGSCSILVRECNRKAKLAARYGMTDEDVEELLVKQSSKCPLCECDLRKLTGRNVVIDHNHACCSGQEKGCGECVRGLLCRNCNLALGHFKDDISALERAIKYLKEK